VGEWQHPPVPRATFLDVLRSEWTKFRSVRSTFWSMTVAVTLTVGLGALVSWGGSHHFANRPADEQANWDPTGVSLFGLLLSQLAFGVLGVLVISSEYTTGMIRTSLAAVPRRRRLLAAKCLIFGLCALVLGEVMAFTAFGIGQAIIHGNAPSVSLGDHNILRAVVGSGLYLAVLGLLAVGIGAILRHGAGAITTLVGLIFIVPLLSNALPVNWGRRPVQKWLPSLAGGQVFAVKPDVHAFGPWAGFAVMCGWTAAILAVAFFLLERRDA